MTAPSAARTKPSEITEVERLGFRWTEIAQYDLSDLSTDRRVQVREPGHYAPRENVERYAIQMAHSQFPPVVVTSDKWIVDGNTRVGAAIARGNKFFPALVLDVPYLTSSQKVQNELHALAATLNAMNGQPLTSREIREVVPRFIALGWKNEQIARAIGVKAASVSLVKKEIVATEKLARVGLDANGSLKGASLRALGSPDTVTLNDVPFREVAQLAADAGFNASEISALTRDVRKTGSDVEQIKVVEDLRATLDERIRERELTGVSKPPVARQLRQHLGFVTKFEGREYELVETAPEATAKHTETLRCSINVLAKVLEQQEAEARS